MKIVKQGCARNNYSEIKLSLRQYTDLKPLVNEAANLNWHKFNFSPPAYEVLGKVMFSVCPVCSVWERWVPPCLVPGLFPGGGKGGGTPVRSWPEVGWGKRREGEGRGYPSRVLAMDGEGWGRRGTLHSGH